MKGAEYGVYALALLGIVFLGILTHEIVHVFHGGGVKSVCLDFNLKVNDDVQQGYLVAHTVFSPDQWENVEAYYTWRELSEKFAGLAQYILIGILACTVGFFTRP